MEVLHTAQAVPQLLILATKPCLTLPFLPPLWPVTTALRHKGLTPSFPDPPLYLLHSDIVAAGCRGVNSIPRSCWHPGEQSAPSDRWAGGQDHHPLLNPWHWMQIFLFFLPFFSRKIDLQGLSPGCHQPVFWVAVSCSRGINVECSKGQILGNAWMCIWPMVLVLNQTEGKLQTWRKKTALWGVCWVTSAIRFIWKLKQCGNIGFSSVLMCIYTPVLPPDSPGRAVMKIPFSSRIFPVCLSTP